MKRIVFRGDVGELTEALIRAERPGRIGISGGRSVVPLLERLKSWDANNLPEFAPVDERLVGERNCDLLRKYLPGEKLLCSTDMQEFLESVGQAGMLVMGVGEDCHMASIFPGLEYHGKVAVIDNSPKPPPKRITITPEFLESFGGKTVLIFKGMEKEEAFHRFMGGECHPYLKDVVVVTDIGEADG